MEHVGAHQRRGRLRHLQVLDSDRRLLAGCHQVDPEGFDARARYLVLAHLSQNNNNPDLARLSAEEALNRRPAEAAFRGELIVAQQYAPLAPIEL